MLGRVTMNADSDGKRSVIHDAMDAALNRRGGAAEKIMRAAMITRAAAHGDLKSLIENLVDVRETRREMKSREDADQEVIKRLEFLEESLERQTKELNKKFDRVIDIFERKPDDVIRRTAMGQRSFVDSRGRELTQNIVTGKFERRAAGNRNAGTDKQDGLDILRGILDYQKKIHAQNERYGKHTERSTKLTERAQQIYERSRGRQGAPVNERGFLGRVAGRAGRAFMTRAFGGRPGFMPGGGNAAGGGGLLDMFLGDTSKLALSGAAGGIAGSAGTAAGFIARRAIPFAAQRILPGAAMLGLAELARQNNVLSVPNTSRGGFDAFMQALDPRLAEIVRDSPSGAPNRPGASGPNANLFPNLPQMLNPRGGPVPNINALSPENDAEIKALQEMKEELKKEIEKLRRSRGARNFRDYRVDQAEREIAGIDNQISSIRGGGVAGGAGGRAGAGGSSGPYIPGVTPGAGQSPSQAQADARQRQEQAQMPAYNPQFSPGTAAGTGPMQLPGSSAAPNGVTGLPITFGGGGPQTTKDALTGNGQGVQRTSTGFFYPGKDVMGGQATAGASNEPDYTRLPQAQKGSSEYQAYAYQFYKARGYSDDAASILMGQANAESRFDPRSLNPNDAPKRAGMTYDIGNGQTYSGADSIGLQQRNGGRAIGMIKNGEAMFGKKWSDMSNQERMYADLDYTDKELKGEDKTNPDGAGQYKKAGDMLNGPGSIADKAGVFGKRFEGYAGPIQGGRTNDALAYAQKAANGGYGNDFSRGGGGPAITASVPGMPGAARGSMDSIIQSAKPGDAKAAMFATVNPTAGSPIGTGSVIEKQQGKTRNLPIQETLKEQLQFAAEKTGVQVEIGSGGQTSERDLNMKNRPGGWTGSHRHDNGGAADLKLYETTPEGGRRLLDMSNPADAQKMQAFTEAAVRAGATGVGAGPGYMGNSTLHIGGGSVASWGGASWIADALKNGRNNMDANAKEFADWKAEKAKAQNNGTPAQAEVGMPQAPGIPGAVTTNTPSVTMAPDAKAASIWSGQAPSDLKSRTLGAQVKAFQAASQERALPDNKNIPSVDAATINPNGTVSTLGPDGTVSTIGPNGAVVATTANAKPAKPSFSDWLNEGKGDAGSPGLKAKIDAADADAKAFNDNFDKEWNSRASASARTPPEMSTPSKTFERQPTPTPPPPLPQAANNATPPPESKSSGGGDEDKSEGAGDAAGGSKKMSEIEMQINDFGLRPLNSSDAA